MKHIIDSFVKFLPFFVFGVFLLFGVSAMFYLTTVPSGPKVFEVISYDYGCSGEGFRLNSNLTLDGDVCNPLDISLNLKVNEDVDFERCTFVIENAFGNVKLIPQKSKSFLKGLGFNTWVEESYSLDIANEFDFDGVLSAKGSELFDFDLDGVVDVGGVCTSKKPCPASYDGRYLWINLSSKGLQFVPVFNEGVEVAKSLKTGEQKVNVAYFDEILGVRIEGVTSEIGYSFGLNGERIVFYRGVTPLDEDYDLDGRRDYLVYSSEGIYVILSSLEFPLLYVEGNHVITFEEFDDYYSQNFFRFREDGQVRGYGYISVEGNNVSLIPELINEGYFLIEPLTSLDDLSIQSGTIVTLHAQAGYAPIHGSEYTLFCLEGVLRDTFSTI